MWIANATVRSSGTARLAFIRQELSMHRQGKPSSALAGQEFDPRLICTQHRRANGSADNQLRDRSDDDLRQRGRHAKPDRKQTCNYRKAQPKRVLAPRVRQPLPNVEPAGKDLWAAPSC